MDVEYSTRHVHHWILLADKSAVGAINRPYGWPGYFVNIRNRAPTEFGNVYKYRLTGQDLQIMFLVGLWYDSYVFWHLCNR